VCSAASAFFVAFDDAVSVDAEKISAELKSGVLTIHLPKTEAVKPRTIQVKAV
jgi:HSP20 family protein